MCVLHKYNLSETDKCRLDAFFRKAKRRGVRHSDFFSSQLIDRADLSSVIVASFFPVLAFHTPGISLNVQDISSLCPN